MGYNCGMSTTMNKTAYIRTRIRPDIKRSAEKVLHKIGLSTSEAISMFMSQISFHAGLPFQAKVPNAETIAALKESEADRKAGRLKTYTSSAEMFAELDAEFATKSDK